MRRAGCFAVLVLVAVTGCTSSSDDRPAPLAPRWSPAALGAGAAVADVTSCGDRLFATGASRGRRGPAPAVWASSDGLAWSAVPTAPTSVYGRLSVLYAAGCRPDVPAALGSAVGGSHGNPRTATWVAAGVTLTENAAPFELYGGPRALSVDRIAGGPLGWLVAGNRSGAGAGNAKDTAGAAVWYSADGREFTLVDADPAMVSAAGEVTRAADVVAGAGGWVVVGTRTVLGGGRVAQQPAAWRSADGRSWHREQLPADNEDEALQRIVAGPAGTLLAAGTRGDRFVLWRRAADRWSRAAEWGANAGSAPGVATVRGLAVAGDRILVAASDGARLVLWGSMDAGRGWGPVRPPIELAATGDTRLAVALHGDLAVVVADSGTTGGIWSARLDG